MLGRLADLDLSNIRVIISYIPTATEAQDFAESIADFFSKQLHIGCERPYAENPNAFPQPRPPVYGSKLMLAAGASAAARKLAKAFSAVVPEAETTGENPAWPLQVNLYQIKIVVGQNR